MRKPTKTAWESAAVRLLDDVYSLVATGPRRYPDWQSDVLAVLNREAEDPRGWRVLDWEFNKEGRALGNASFPFRPLSRDTVAEHLWEITREDAAHILEIMSYDWEWHISPSPEEAARRVADTHLLLDRYGDEVSCYTNVRGVGDSLTLDLAARRIRGWWPFTEYSGDFGFVVVSPEEVGVFWTFDPR
ncbi:hypothetical protein ABZX40_15565 [Streptomyces sp. NPDC004610]|uniref:hypothetical protein n=1 Tax=unclassified Streptomyces TaxID=2593676 RepID=UPI0033A65B44